MFIDSSYFVGEAFIPNLDKNATNIDQAIVQYEEEILIDLLGYKLYSLLIADCINGVPQSQIYKDLVDGAEFTHNFRGQEILLKWKGLQNTAKQSLIAYYTFYQYVSRDVTHLSGVGVIKTPSGNDMRASSVNKLCNAWERMRSLYGIIPPEYKKYLGGYSGEITAIPSSQLPYTFNCDPSAYNFLFANKYTYPDWMFTPKWNTNAFGI